MMSGHKLGVVSGRRDLLAQRVHMADMAAPSFLEQLGSLVFPCNGVALGLPDDIIQLRERFPTKKAGCRVAFG